MVIRGLLAVLLGGMTREVLLFGVGFSRGDGGGMVGAAGLFEDGEGLLVEGFGLLVFPLITVELR